MECGSLTYALVFERVILTPSGTDGVEGVGRVVAPASAIVTFNGGPEGAGGVIEPNKIIRRAS